MEKFIEFIIDLTNDELYDFVEGDSQIFFLRGGCYEFAKILKRYVSECKIVINKDSEHCGVLYRNKVYDANGIVRDSSEFKIASQSDIDYMEDRFGIPEKRYISGNKKISDFIIDEIANCNINYILDEFEEEER